MHRICYEDLLAEAERIEGRVAPSWRDADPGLWLELLADARTMWTALADLDEAEGVAEAAAAVAGMRCVGDLDARAAELAR